MTDLPAAFTGRTAWSVGALIAAVAEVVQAGFAACSVRGEISGFTRAGSGHCYFSIKDPDAGVTLRCAMFRRAAQLAAFLPVEGDAVELRGRLAIYEPRGELQFIVESLHKSGAGALYERFLERKAKLEAEGLFAAESKRALPRYPAVIGVVTSIAGAALHDVATALARRSPHVRVVLYPSLVQGDAAPAALCRALALAQTRDEVDVLILCRGGGSLEDLWAFNDESVVRAIRGSRVPVVSGVGHETDVTLADLAADLRAATPTAAAELAARATRAELEMLEGHEFAITRRLEAFLEREMQRLDRLSMRLARPVEAVRRRASGIDLLAHRLAGVAQQGLAAGRLRGEALARRLRLVQSLARASLAARVDRAAIRLRGVDPRQVLLRGYVLLADERGRPLSQVGQLQVGASVTATLSDGRADLVVRTVAADRAQC